MTQKSHFDLVVLGGGPGGCSAAILAAREGADVLLLERSAYPRHKVCGEFVSPESLPLLADLLGQQQYENLPSCPIEQVAISADGNTATIPVAPAAASITRFILDDALWQAAITAGVTCRQKTTANQLAGEGPFTIKTSAGDFSAKAVIDASGRWSNLNATVETNSDKLLGIKAHFKGNTRLRSVHLYFFSGGYCGIQPLAGGLVNACALVRASAASTLDQVFALHPQLFAESRDWVPMMEPVYTSPLIFRKPEPARGNVLRVGDAAGFVDPFTGDGIALALHSGKVAAQSLNPFFQGEGSLEGSVETYRKAYSQKLLPVFRGSQVLRRIMAAPEIVRRAAFIFMRIPALAGMAVKKTRVVKA